MFLWRAVKLILEYHVMKQPDSLVKVHTNGSLDNEPSSQKFAIALFPIKVNENTLRGSNSAIFIFSLPGQSPGRAIILPPASALASALASASVLALALGVVVASALAKSLTLKFFM